MVIQWGVQRAIHAVRHHHSTRSWANEMKLTRNKRLQSQISAVDGWRCVNYNGSGYIKAMPRDHFRPYTAASATSVSSRPKRADHAAEFIDDYRSKYEIIDQLIWHCGGQIDWQWLEAENVPWHGSVSNWPIRISFHEQQWHAFVVSRDTVRKHAMYKVACDKIDCLRRPRRRPHNRQTFDSSLTSGLSRLNSKSNVVDHDSTRPVMLTRQRRRSSIATLSSAVSTTEIRENILNAEDRTIQLITASR